MVGAPAYRPAGAVYRPRGPTETPLYRVVLHHLETFLTETQDADRGVRRSGWAWGPDYTPNIVAGQ
jgi:hypothetical protein